MGLLAGDLAFRGDAAQAWRLFLTTGILGGFTTFSTFSLDTALLYERGAHGLAGLYVLASVGASIRPCSRVCSSCAACYEAAHDARACRSRDLPGMMDMDPR